MEPPAPAEPPPRTVPGRYRYGCAVAVTVVLSLFLCCGLSLVQCLAPNFHAPPPSSAVPTAFTGSVLLGMDRVTVSFPRVDAQCRQLSVALIPDRQRVALYASYTPLELVECDRADRVPRMGSVRLNDRLGSRSIVDSVTGAVVPYFDMRAALRPRLPIPDWPATPDAPYGELSVTAPDLGGPGSAVLVESFVRSATVNGQPHDDRLRVIQVTGGGWNPPPGTATTRSRFAAGRGVARWASSCGRRATARSPCRPERTRARCCPPTSSSPSRRPSSQGRTGEPPSAAPPFAAPGAARAVNLPDGHVHRYDTASFPSETVPSSSAGCVQIYPGTRVPGEIEPHSAAPGSSR